MSASTNDIPQGQPSELSDSKNVTSESPRPNNSVQVSPSHIPPFTFNHKLIFNLKYLI